MCECRPMASGKRLDRDRDDSLENVGETDARYDISTQGFGTTQAFINQESESSDTESAYSDHEKELSAEFIAADEAEMLAAAVTLSRSNSEVKTNEGMSEGLLRRIAGTLSSTPLKRSSTMLTLDSLKEVVEAPNKVRIPAQDMDINEEIAAAAADLDRCIQVHAFTRTQLPSFTHTVALHRPFPPRSANSFA
jgi:hypothetical protein